MWNTKQLADHHTAARRLETILADSFAFVKKHPDCTESELQHFIGTQFKSHALISDRHPPIVAFGESTAHVHYFPDPKSSRKLTPNTLIMLDVWARTKNSHAPFADITWMGYFGSRVPRHINHLFETVLKARDEALGFITNAIVDHTLPTGAAADAAARQVIAQAGYEQRFLHSTGHVLGTRSPHGQGRNLSPKSNLPLLPGYGYTIEPGIYFDGRYGLRSEINFFIHPRGKLLLTTAPQTALMVI